MPLDLPNLDNRRYQDLLTETLARVPVHTPEWTNYGPSDPGRTLVELFCFLTESLLYTANQIPERNRRKFLQLLGVPLQPGGAARGIVTFANERGLRRTETLNADLEARAGKVPFQTERAIDVLPIEGKVYYKRKLADPSDQVKQYYELLYASYQADAPARLQLYEVVPLEINEPYGIDLASDTVDGSLWIALLTRAGDQPAEQTVDGWSRLRDDVRKAIAGKTLSLGLVPALLDVSRRLSPVGNADAEGEPLLRYEFPKPPRDGALPADPKLRVAEYKARDPRAVDNVLSGPGVVEIGMPAKEELGLWTNLDPLEAGVGDFPPAVDDTNLDRRIVTWLRVRATGGAHVRLLWAGINAVMVRQRARVFAELLAGGTGLPDQVRVLSKKPVIANSVQLSVTHNGSTETWKEIDDLLLAGPEVDVPDPSLPPGRPRGPARPAAVFVLDQEAGELRFGDGLRGKRPPENAILRATYDYSVGGAGNVGKNMIDTGPALPAGFAVTNPVRTWGGADAESVAQGERQITRYLQHRERLVTAEDFETIAMRTPGVEIGRLEVLPAFHPELSPNQPGDAPGVVTLLVVPRNDPLQPDAPSPDRPFLNALCRHLDPRRLVTTEVILRGPEYVPVWISVGINVKAGYAVPEVREGVRKRLTEFLAPVYPAQSDDAAPPGVKLEKGWPLRKHVDSRELMAEASRVAGVLSVSGLELAKGTDAPATPIAMVALQLPRVMGIAVSVGEPQPIDALRGQQTGAVPSVDDGGTPTRVVPVPFVTEECS